jgi:hypothetical protein
MMQLQTQRIGIEFVNVVGPGSFIASKLLKSTYIVLRGTLCDGDSIHFNQNEKLKSRVLQFSFGKYERT